MADTKAGDLRENNGGCIDHTFPGWSVAPTVQNATQGFRMEGYDQIASGCLVFNWNKKNPNNNYIGSDLRFVWTFVRGSAGFAVYLKGVVQESKKMKFEGFGYAMKKEGGKWLAVQKKVLTQDTIALGNESFPKSDGDVFKNGNINEYWDFLNEDGKEVKVAEGNVNSRTERWKWIGKGSSDEGVVCLDDWSDNLEAWWRYFFGYANVGLIPNEIAREAYGGWEKW